MNASKAPETTKTQNFIRPTLDLQGVRQPLNQPL
jgi:hypothetical protein